MPKIIWDESFSVNNTEIDNQHKKWIQIINELHDALIAGKGLGKITAKSVSAMIDYGKYHFSYEEGQMKKFNYPCLIEHSVIHSQFMDHMKRIQEKQELGKTVLNREIMDELMNWLLDHILKEDQKYSPYLSKTKTI